jgi:hypothetical protein
MTELYKYQVPGIGTKGIFTLLSPFTTENNEVYECIAVRTISAYLAAGEDPLSVVYVPVQLTEDDYLEDAALDMQIVTLRNDKGYSIYVPARYISKYPIQDGVDFASYVIQLFLPPFPVDQNTTAFESELKELALQRLGVESQVDKVQTSDVRSIERQLADTIVTDRLVTINGNVTAFAQVAQLQAVIEQQKARIKALEDYIESK